MTSKICICLWDDSGNLKDKTVEYQCALARLSVWKIWFSTYFRSPVFGSSIASSLIPHAGPNLQLIFPPRADAGSLSFRFTDICQSVRGWVPQGNAYFGQIIAISKTISRLPKQQRQHRTQYMTETWCVDWSVCKKQTITKLLLYYYATI